MPVLRLFVLIASVVQLVVGGYAGLYLMQLARPDLIGLVLCSTVVVAGLASLSGMWTQPRSSMSRRSTIKLNVLLLGLVLTAAMVMMTIENHFGAPPERLRFLVIVFAAGASPFLVNSFALFAIERRMMKVITG